MKKILTIILGSVLVLGFMPVSAKGPWIITSHGAVVHDNGGYGMLGPGHGPDLVIDTMSKNWVMANVMTPSFSQKRLE